MLVNILIEECMFDTIRKKIKQDLFQLSGTDGAAKGRETYMKTDNNPVIGNLTGASFQNFLSASGDGHQTTFSGALCLELIRFKFGCKESDQMILKSDAIILIYIIFFWKLSIVMKHLDMKTGR